MARKRTVLLATVIVIGLIALLLYIAAPDKPKESEPRAVELLSSLRAVFVTGLEGDLWVEMRHHRHTSFGDIQDKTLTYRRVGFWERLDDWVFPYDWKEERYIGDPTPISYFSYKNGIVWRTFIIDHQAKSIHIDSQNHEANMTQTMFADNYSQVMNAISHIQSSVGNHIIPNFHAGYSSQPNLEKVYIVAENVDSVTLEIDIDPNEYRQWILSQMSIVHRVGYSVYTFFQDRPFFGYERRRVVGMGKQSPHRLDSIRVERYPDGDEHEWLLSDYRLNEALNREIAHHAEFRRFNVDGGEDYATITDLLRYEIPDPNEHDLLDAFHEFSGKYAIYTHDARLGHQQFLSAEEMEILLPPR